MFGTEQNCGLIHHPAETSFTLQGSEGEISTTCKRSGHPPHLCCWDGAQSQLVRQMAAVQQMALHLVEHTLKITFNPTVADCRVS
jgi:hypothetical protein